jgi:hypothetical protein
MTDQTGLVPPLTYRLLEVVGHPERAALLYRLMHGESTSKQLRTAGDAPEGNPYLRRTLEQSVGSRFLTRFTDIGVAEPGLEPKTYRLTCPSETRDLLEAANRLSLAIGRGAEAEDRRIDKALRRTRVTSADKGQRSTG